MLSKMFVENVVKCLISRHFTLDNNRCPGQKERKIFHHSVGRGNGAGFCFFLEYNCLFNIYEMKKKASAIRKALTFLIRNIWCSKTGGLYFQCLKHMFAEQKGKQQCSFWSTHDNTNVCGTYVNIETMGNTFFSVYIIKFYTFVEKWFWQTQEKSSIFPSCRRNLVSRSDSGFNKFYT